MSAKEYISAVLLVISGGLVGFFWKSIPETPALILLVVCYAILFGLYLLFARQALLRYTIPSISLGALALLLGLNQFTLVGLGIAICFVLIAGQVSEREYKNSLTLSPPRIIGRSLKLFFTGLAVLFACAYYGDIHQTEQSVDQLLPRTVFEISLKAVEGPLRNIVPGFTTESTLDEVLVSMVQKEQGGSVNASALAQIQVLVKRNRPQMLRELERQLGIDLNIATLSGKEKAADILYAATIAKTEEYVRAYIGYLPMIVAVSYFFALKVVSIGIYLISTAVILLILQILLWIGVARKDTTMVAKEIIY